MSKSLSYLFLKALAAGVLCSAAALSLPAQDTLSRQADSLLISAVEQYQKGNNEQAKKLLDRAGTLDSQNDAVQYYLGYLALSSRDVGAALNHFEQAYYRDSTNVWYGMRLAQLYNASGKFEQAEGIYESLLNKRQGDLNVLSSLVDIYMQSGKYDKADSALTKIERIGGSSEYTAVSRIELYRQKGDFKEFFSSLNDFFSNAEVKPSVKKGIMERMLNGSDPRFNYFHIADYDTLLETCMRTHPGDTSIVHFAGSFHFSTGRSDKLQPLCRQYGDDVRMLSLSVYDYVRNQDYKSALPVCDELVRQIEKGNGLAGKGDVNPEELMLALTTRGDCYFNLEVPGKAFRDYEKALRLDPESAVTLNNYAYYLSVLNTNLGKAMKMSQKAVAMEPENATFLDTYGWILYRKKKYAEAKAVFKKVMVYGGKESPEVLRHYAAVLDALGESALADAYRQQAEMKANGKKR